MLVANAVVDTDQPRLQVGENQMDDRQVLLGNLWITTLGNSEVLIAALTEASIAAPIVSNDQRSRRDGALDEPTERLGATVEHDGEPNATIDGRMFYGKHARRLVPKLIKRAIQEAEKPRGNLDFAERIGKLAAAYAFGRPVDRQEVSGPDGTPIATDLLPMEAMQRLGGLLAAHQAQQPPAGPPVIDVEAETIAAPEAPESEGGGAERAATAGRADD